MGELDDAASLVPTGPLTFRAQISDAWGIGPIPNGGYLMFHGAKALSLLLAHPDPLTVTARYARPIKPGPAEVRCEIIKQGRTQSAGVAVFLQDGKERFRVTATFGDLVKRVGPTIETIQAPSFPEPDALPQRGAAPFESTFADRVELRFARGTDSFLDGELGEMEVGGWIRLADGREVDVFALLLMADAWPPPALRAIEPRVWVPTVELTVHVRRRPAPGWIAAWFETRSMIEGALEEDGRLFDETGRLVALSRQYAQLL